MDDDIILETFKTTAGLSVRAIAPDGLEVSFIAPLTAGRAELGALAARKLDYVRSRQQASKPTQSNDGKAPERPVRKRGWMA